ncbi:hypothetical protein SO802_017554 [Lithocarpus litseifolius]|uniref:Aminotransferase-like plant mobile domain-containing protein n=1 Tax=Lithocarpus litseifolius TaxID=425828 RepID=A0AAW2CIA2_9ROSI
MEWPTLCRDLLGHLPLDLVPHPHENMSILAGVRLRVSLLKEQFRGPLPANATGEVVQQHVRYHILVWLGSILFMDKHLCKASEMKGKQIEGALMLVQLWVYLRFLVICLVMRPPQLSVEAGPLAKRWKGPKRTTEHATHVLAVYRTVEHTSTPGERVTEAPTLDGDMTYLVAYMESYRRMTRRYITRESAYWEMLVESSVASLLQCELGSKMYNQLLRTLDLVGELSRVALENERAASEESIQATGSGGRGGGSGGRGDVGGRRGGHGPAPTPVRSCEDDDDSGNFHL